MSNNLNQQVSGTASAAFDAPASFAISEMGKDAAQWTLTLHPHHLALVETTETQPYIIVREEMMKSATLMEGMRAFVLQKPKKITFKLSPEASETLAEWVGKPILAGIYLKQRYGWILPIAVIWIIGALPMTASPNAGAIPFDLIGLIMGLTLVICWALAKWRPHPGLFLVDSIWFLVMAVQLIADVFDGRSKAWLVLVFFMGWMTVSGLRHFVRFKGIKIKRDAS